MQLNNKRQKQRLNSPFEIIGRPLAVAVIQETDDYKVDILVQHRRYQAEGDMVAYVQRSIVYPKTGIAVSPAFEVLALINVETWLALEDAIYTRRLRPVGGNLTVYEYFEGVSLRQEENGHDIIATEDRSASSHNRG